MTTKCPRCEEGEASIDSFLGVLPCTSCQESETTHKKPSPYPEFTRQEIKDARMEYRKDILQPWHDGVLSKEYLEEYGTSGVEATKTQIKNAKYTYKGYKGWWKRKDSRGGRSKEWKEATMPKQLLKEAA